MLHNIKPSFGKICYNLVVCTFFCTFFASVTKADICFVLDQDCINHEQTRMEEDYTARNSCNGYNDSENLATRINGLSCEVCSTNPSKWKCFCEDGKERINDSFGTRCVKNPDTCPTEPMELAGLTNKFDVKQGAGWICEKCVEMDSRSAGKYFCKCDDDHVAVGSGTGMRCDLNTCLFLKNKDPLTSVSDAISKESRGFTCQKCTDGSSKAGQYAGEAYCQCIDGTVTHYNGNEYCVAGGCANGGYFDTMNDCSRNIGTGTVCKQITSGAYTGCYQQTDDDSDACDPSSLGGYNFTKNKLEACSAHPSWKTIMVPEDIATTSRSNKPCYMCRPAECNEDEGYFYFESQCKTHYNIAFLNRFERIWAAVVQGILPIQDAFAAPQISVAIDTPTIDPGNDGYQVFVGGTDCPCPKTGPGSGAFAGLDANGRSTYYDISPCCLVLADDDIINNHITIDDIDYKEYRCFEDPDTRCWYGKLTDTDVCPEGTGFKDKLVCQPDEDKVDSGQTSAKSHTKCYKCVSNKCANGPYSWRDSECCGLDKYKNTPICQKPKCTIEARGAYFTYPFKPLTSFAPTEAQCADDRFVSNLGLYAEGTTNKQCVADDPLVAMMRYCGSISDFAGIDDLNKLANRMFETEDEEFIINNVTEDDDPGTMTGQYDWYQRPIPSYRFALHVNDSALVEAMKAYLTDDGTLDNPSLYHGINVAVRDRYTSYQGHSTTGAVVFEYGKQLRDYGYYVANYGTNGSTLNLQGICTCDELTTVCDESKDEYTTKETCEAKIGTTNKSCIKDSLTRCYKLAVCPENPGSHITAECELNGYNIYCKFYTNGVRDKSKYKFKVQYRENSSIYSNSYSYVEETSPVNPVNVATLDTTGELRGCSITLADGTVEDIPIINQKCSFYKYYKDSDCLISDDNTITAKVWFVSVNRYKCSATQNYNLVTVSMLEGAVEPYLLVTQNTTTYMVPAERIAVNNEADNPKTITFDKSKFTYSVGAASDGSKCSFMMMTKENCIASGICNSGGGSNTSYVYNPNDVGQVYFSTAGQISANGEYVIIRRCASCDLQGNQIN